MTVLPTPDLDTALILGMASTAIPFARSREAEAERWLRILRLYGEAGVALQALGVSEGPLEEPAGDQQEQPAPDAPEEAVVARVLDDAAAAAHRRGSAVVTSEDVLRAVMGFYGSAFDHVLRAHGTDRDEVLARLDLQTEAA
ncbi:MAG TPA: hypothetical protein VGD00_02710 [Solirubrobacteraceae bacterium]|jgi:hypothetical protein